MRTFCRFGLKRRRVATMEWLRELPNAGPLPQEKQTFAMSEAILAGAARPVAAGRSDSSDERLLDQRHPHHRMGRGSALVALLAAGPRQGLLQGLAGDDAEAAWDAGGDLHLLDAARGLRADVVVVVRLAPDHR